MKILRQNLLLASLAILALLAAPLSARANVYATNIKIDGVLSGSASVAVGAGATITYILNDTASAGVSVKILLAGLPVRTINIAAGNPGTTRGLNTIHWDGNNDLAVPVPVGSYSVSITSGHTGYSTWTPITHDSDPGNSAAYWPDGLAVDTSTNSPYYGRVMVANGTSLSQGPAGVIKCNADGSLADEGQSNAGYSFPQDGYLGDSIRSMKYITDDRIIFNNWTGNGTIIACDMIMSTNQILWDSGNLPGAGWVGGLTYGMSDTEVIDPGTSNALALVASADYPSPGVWAWPLTNNGAYDPNFGGIQILDSSPSCADTLRTGFGLMVDENYDVFMGQVRANPYAPVPRLLSFTNWSSTTLPLCTQNLYWAIGDGSGGDPTFTLISDLCVDSRRNPNYVACVFSGGVGGLCIVYATNGAVAANIQQGLVPTTITRTSVAGGTVSLTFTGVDPSDIASDFLLQSTSTLSPTSWSTATGSVVTGSGGSYTATAPTSGGIQFYRIMHAVYFISVSWDNVGNVYGGTGAHVWRAFSPPGANQATTVAVATVTVHP